MVKEGLLAGSRLALYYIRGIFLVIVHSRFNSWWDVPAERSPLQSHDRMGMSWVFAQSRVVGILIMSMFLDMELTRALWPTVCIGVVCRRNPDAVLVVVGIHRMEPRLVPMTRVCLARSLLTDPGSDGSPTSKALRTHYDTSQIPHP